MSQHVVPIRSDVRPAHLRTLEPCPAAAIIVEGVDLRADTVVTYLQQALTGMQRALDRFDDTSVNVRPHGEGTNSAAALIVHACSSSSFWLEHVGLGRQVQRDRDSEFSATATVAELTDLLRTTSERFARLVSELDQGPTDADNEWRGRLHGGDHSDGSLVLHVLEELFQHLGHLELTADAVGTRS